MKMKNNKGIVFAMFLFCVLLITVGCTQTQQGIQATNTNNNNQVTQPNNNEQIQTDTQVNNNAVLPGIGTIVFSVSDQSTNAGNLNNIIFSISSLYVHSKTNGWVSIPASSHIYDLIQLRKTGNISFFSNTSISSGDFDMIKFNIGSMKIYDANGKHDVIIPSALYQSNFDFTIQPNKVASINLGFMGTDSVHMTGDGRYVLTPIINIDAKSDSSISIDLEKNLKIIGTTTSSEKVGMGPDGTVGTDLIIAPGVQISIGANNLLTVTGS